MPAIPIPIFAAVVAPHWRVVLTLPPSAPDPIAAVVQDSDGKLRQRSRREARLAGLEPKSPARVQVSDRARRFLLPE